MDVNRVLNNLERVLDELLHEIGESRINLIGTGAAPKPYDMSYADFWKKIYGYETRLASLVRELGKVETHLDFRSRLARKVPREFRYGANQSVRSHRDHTRRVYEKAVQVEQALRDYMGRGLTPTTGDIVSGLERLARNLQKTVTKADYQAITQQLSQGQGNLTSLTGGAPIVHGTPLTLIVTLIAIWVGAAKKRKDAREDKKNKNKKK